MDHVSITKRETECHHVYATVGGGSQSPCRLRVAVRARTCMATHQQQTRGYARDDIRQMPHTTVDVCQSDQKACQTLNTIEGILVFVHVHTVPDEIMFNPMGTWLELMSNR